MAETELIDALKIVIAEAQKDGRISEDEYLMLNRISIDAAMYSITLEKAKADGVIDEEERKHLEELKKKILVNAKHLAESDNEVTKEEFQMLIKLMDALDK